MNMPGSNPLATPTLGDDQLHPIIAQRWSPRSYSPRYRCGDEQLGRLLAAARWSPSHRNSQPWRFIAGRRGDDVFDRLFQCLVPANQRWAATAAVLICAIARLRDDTDAELPLARYDLGQAMAYLTVQAHADGLHSRQMAGFDQQAVRRAFSIGRGYEPCVIVAVGVLAEPGEVHESLRQRDLAIRERIALDQLVYLPGGPEFAWCRPGRPSTSPEGPRP